MILEDDQPISSLVRKLSFPNTKNNQFNNAWKISALRSAQNIDHFREKTFQTGQRWAS